MLKIFKNTPSSDFSHLPNYGVDEMRAFVESISFPRPFNTLENDRARELVVAEFLKLGRQPKIVGSTKNVVVGDVESAKIIVGAHYDSVATTPGADDNGSALASMFRVLANTKEDVCFVAFNGEECGLLGSFEIAELAKSVQEVHVLEMVGYKTTEPNSQINPLAPFVNDMPTIGDFIGVVTNDESFSQGIATKCNIDLQIIGLTIEKQILNLLPSNVKHVTRSDHYPFWLKDVFASMWTDTSEFRNRNYHKSTDTPETLDYYFMASVADAVVKAISNDN